MMARMEKKRIKMDTVFPALDVVAKFLSIHAAGRDTIIGSGMDRCEITGRNERG